MTERSIDNIDSSIIKEIRQKYGSPVYIFDETSFERNFIKLQKAFLEYYPKYRIAYSYKTNYMPYIGRLVRNLGGLAEVVSDFELFTALKNGNRHQDIIYNGPLKQKMLDEFIINGGVVNIDNIQECERILDIAKRNPGKYLKVGIRVNLDVGQSFISRFGLEPASKEFEAVINMLKSLKNIDLCGLHCHIGQSRTEQNWIIRVKSMLELSDSIFTSLPPKYIDLGSGMYGDMEPQLKEQFGDNIPSYSDYARIVAETFDSHFKKYSFNDKPFLYTEPGATVASRYMWLLTTITSHKNVRNREITGVDSSFFDAGETCRYKKLPIRIVASGKEFVLGDVVGYTCLEDDCIYANCSRKASIGDIILFGNTGGYSLVFKPPFIMPEAPVVLLKEDFSHRVIKKRQSFENMLELYD